MLVWDHFGVGNAIVGYVVWDKLVWDMLRCGLCLCGINCGTSHSSQENHVE